jgi:hypothetical protein
MSVPEIPAATDFSLLRRATDVQKARRVAPAGKDVAAEFERYQTRESLEQALREAKDVGSQPRKFTSHNKK